DVPGAEVIGVIALLRIAGGRAEIGEVAACARRPIVVVARGRPGPRPEPPPARVVAAGELLRGPGVVHIVSEREDRALDAIEERRGLLVAVARARSDVARTDEDGI